MIIELPSPLGRIEDNLCPLHVQKLWTDGLCVQCKVCWGLTLDEQDIPMLICGSRSQYGITGIHMPIRNLDQLDPQWHLSKLVSFARERVADQKVRYPHDH